MQHMLMKATVTEATTDQGTFTAVISTASLDRDGDIIEPSAMVESLMKWTSLGKLVPLAYNHSEEVIGHIDPVSATVQNGEVIAKGFVDQSVPRGAEIWRLVKSGTLSFSFGFLYDPNADAEQVRGGRYRIKRLDIFEISAIPIAPANNDTRVLSYKSLDDIKDAVEEAKREAEQATMPEVPADAVIVEPEPEPELEPSPVVPVPSAEEIREMVLETTKELARDAQRDALPAPVDAMTKAFDSFKPAGRTAEQVAQNLDGLALDDGTLFVRLVNADEVVGVKSGAIKAVWSVAFINNLPDSAFLYVEAGEKDAEGKTTPRSKRHFPYKDADGSVDLPHLRNALARIPQSSLPQDVKDRLTRKAQGILDSSKSVDVTDKEKDPNRGGSRSVDPLVREVNTLATQFERDLFPRKQVTTPPPAPVSGPSPDELQRQAFEETMVHLRNEFNG
jgi:hypothetical protein